MIKAKRKTEYSKKKIDFELIGYIEPIIGQFNYSEIKKLGSIDLIGSIISENKIDEALQACDTNRGSLANVLKNGLQTYTSIQLDKTRSANQKVLALQKELEEATHIEIPVLNKNMVIISTLASISTLIGLLGTVTGMIKAFSALARVGAPDAVGLAAGISQALVTTALGISTAAVAIVLFNYFSAQIDKITQHIDEASFTLLQSLKLKA